MVHEVFSRLVWNHVAPLILTFLFIGIGWFIIIRPQQERARAQRATVASLAVGDRVVSAGGIHGTVIEVATDTIGLEVASGIVLTLARPAIARRIGTSADADHDDDLESDPDGADGPTPGAAGPPVKDDVKPENDGPIAGGLA